MTNVNTWKPTTGGILSIVAGSMHLIGWLVIGLGVMFFGVDDGFSHTGPGSIFISSFGIMIIFLPLIALSIVPIVGGIFAIRRKNWGLSLAGAICAIVSPFTWILGVVATILIATSKPEFNRTGSTTTAVTA